MTDQIWRKLWDLGIDPPVPDQITHTVPVPSWGLLYSLKAYKSR